MPVLDFILLNVDAYNNVLLFQHLETISKHK